MTEENKETLGEKYERVDNLIKEFLGNDTNYKFIFVNGDANRPGGIHIILDYIMRHYISTFTFPNNKEICKSLVEELEETKKEIDKDIELLRRQL